MKRLSLHNIKYKLNTPRGRNLVIFTIFLFISGVLWLVQALNEELQVDLRCPVRIVNQPDSITRISPMPEAVNVSVRARGTQLLRFALSGSPEMQIDYRAYKNGNRIVLNEAAIKSYFRNLVGSGSQIQSVTPDSLMMNFTSRPGVKMPVRADIREDFGTEMAVIKKVQITPDTVTLYSIDILPARMHSVATEAIALTDITATQQRRVAVPVAAGIRSVPDSVDVLVEVEPYVSKTAYAEIIPVHVPAGTRVTTIPALAEVYYMVPMSVYTSTTPIFRVEADYAATAANPASGKMPVRLASVPPRYVNVFLGIDSVEYIREER